jgi:hypothetical protein
LPCAAISLACASMAAISALECFLLVVMVPPNCNPQRYGNRSTLFPHFP